MSVSIYVGNLPYSTKEEALQEIFSEHGEVVKVQIITDKLSGKSKGFAFIEMADEAAAEAAIKDLNNGELDGRQIKVNLAKEKSDDTRKFRNREGGNGGYRGDNSGKKFYDKRR